MDSDRVVICTHHKCATKWLGSIAQNYCERLEGQCFHTHLSEGAPTAGEQYCAYLWTNSDYAFASRVLSEFPTTGSVRAIHVIRNPLDMVVSAYYSHLGTHEVDGWPALAEQRELLQRLPKKAGLESTADFLERDSFYEGAVGPLAALRRWDFTDRRFRALRMEDLVADPVYAASELNKVFGVDGADIIAAHSFESMSGGRPLGTADNACHYRLGTPDQWMDEMQRPLAEAIYSRHKSLCDQFYPSVAVALKRRKWPLFRRR